MSGEKSLPFSSSGIPAPELEFQRNCRFLSVARERLSVELLRKKRTFAGEHSLSLYLCIGLGKKPRPSFFVQFTLSPLGVSLNLSARENKFLKMVYDGTGGDTFHIMMGGELYQLAARNGFDRGEVLNIPIALNALGLLEKRRQDGGRKAGDSALEISCVRLTPSGKNYAQSLG
jgi:hypothetical protein